MSDIAKLIKSAQKTIEKCANQLDDNGLVEVANELDKALEDLSKAASGVTCFGPTGRLSTRHCPDHHGIQSERVGDHLVRCPLDGKQYDFINGYKTYDGVVHPGAYPDKQTPDDASFYDAPHRFLTDSIDDEKKKF